MKECGGGGRVGFWLFEPNSAQKKMRLDYIVTGS